jgi:hypothetical protein
MALFHYIRRCTSWNTETPSEAGWGRKKASGAKSIERAILELRAGRHSNSRWLNAVATRCLIAMLLLLPPTSRVDRSPGYPPRFQTTYKPEAMTSYKAGTKLRLLDRTLNVRLAGFFEDYTNIQEALLNVVVEPVSNEPGGRLAMNAAMPSRRSSVDPRAAIESAR